MVTYEGHYLFSIIENFSISIALLEFPGEVNIYLFESVFYLENSKENLIHVMALVNNSKNNKITFKYIYNILLQKQNKLTFKM